MTRTEFLDKLRNALENEMDNRNVQDNVNYYNSYIEGELNKGKSESEVLKELGDPWVISRSLVEAAENTGDIKSSFNYGGSESEKAGEGGHRQNMNQGGKPYMLDAWWKKLLLVLGIVGVILVVIAVIGGIFRLLMPIIVPVLLIILLIRLIGGRRR